MLEANRPTWLEINRSALVNNVHQLRQIVGADRKLMAVVKANAYGHGALDVARIALASEIPQAGRGVLGHRVDRRGRNAVAAVHVIAAGRGVGEAVCQLPEQRSAAAGHETQDEVR